MDITHIFPWSQGKTPAAMITLGYKYISNDEEKDIIDAIAQFFVNYDRFPQLGELSVLLKHEYEQMVSFFRNTFFPLPSSLYLLPL